MGRIEEDQDRKDDNDNARSVSGNASDKVKAVVRHWLGVCVGRGFGTRSVQGLKLVEVSIGANAEEAGKREARVVLEMDVTQDMVNSEGKVHGACIVHLVDICTVLPISAVAFEDGIRRALSVSQNISVVYHAPAVLGNKLRLISTSMVIGVRLRSVRIEIWDTTHHRLVAFATQVKMEASPAKL